MTCPNEPTLLLFAEKIDDSCRRHVDACAECRSTVTELGRTIDELRAATPAAEHRVLTLPPPPASSRRLFFAAAAVILVVTGFGLYRPGAGTRPKDPVVSPAKPSPVPAPRDEASEMAAKGLQWLAKNQKDSGSFGSVGLTGLALQAFFAAGHDENSPDYGGAIRKALGFLLTCQMQTGEFAGTDLTPTYDNAIAAWALAEAVDGKRSGDPRIRQAAEKSVAFLVSAQNPGKGWRYSSKCGDNDTSVTFWAASALATARRAGMKVPDEALAGAKAWIGQVTDPETLAVGYNAPRTGKVYVPGVNDAYQHHPSMSAAGMALRLLAGDARDAAMVSAVGFLATDPPSAATVEQQDFYYWHLGTIALFLNVGAESPLWQDWNARLLKALKVSQQEDGSWTANDRWARIEEAGPVYATAINALTLETARRFKK
jgi:hypothetical protein